MRPNPFLVTRQPPAKVRGNIVRANTENNEIPSDMSDLNFRALVERITSADLITEGARYLSETPAKFFGSAVLTLRRVSDASARPVNASPELLADQRLKRVIEDRLYREILRHLGSEAPFRFDWQGRETQESGEHRVFVDFECDLTIRSHANGQVSL